MSNPKEIPKGNIVWHLCIIAVILWASFSHMRSITFKDIEPLVSLLQNSSAMVFTIMGIWIAYVYPNAILRITQPSKVDAVFSEADEERITLIVGVVILSAGVMCALLIGLTIKTLIQDSAFYKNCTAFVNFVGMACFLSLIYAQLFSVYVVIASNVNFILDLRNLRNKERNNRKLNKSLKLPNNSPGNDPQPK